MAIDRKYLDNKIGRRVVIVLMNGREIEGKLESCDENAAVIVKDNGDEASVALNLIGGIDPIDSAVVADSPSLHASLAENMTTDVHYDEETHALPNPSAPEAMQEELNAILTEMKNGASAQFDVRAFIKPLRKRDAASAVKAEKILSGYEYAVKIKEDGVGSNRMKDITDAAKKDYYDNTDSNISAAVYGYMLLKNGDAESGFSLLMKNSLFLPAAQITPDGDKKTEAAACAVLSGDIPCAACGMLLEQPFAKIAPLISAMLETKPDDTDARKYALTMAWSSGKFSHWIDNVQIESDANIDSLKKWLAEHSGDAELLSLAKNRTASISQDTEQHRACDGYGEFIGTIQSFSTEANDKGMRFVGTIFSKDLFARCESFLDRRNIIRFNINQVFDLSLRRKLLIGQSDIKVAFTIGQTDKGYPVADNIRIADDSVDAAAETACGGDTAGEIIFYDRERRFGKIRFHDGELLTFQERNITDNMLFARLDTFDLPSDDVIPVYFIKRSGSNKSFADNIRSAMPFSDDMMAKLRPFVVHYGGMAEHMQASELSPDLESVLNLAPYNLEKLKPQPAAKPVNSAQMQGADVPDSFCASSLSTGGIAVSIPKSAVAYKNGLSAFEQGHEKFIANKDKEAERLFLQAVDEGDHIQSALNNLITIYVRNKEFEKAEEIIDTYSSVFDKDKLVNAKISIYAASKSNTSELIKLYGAAADLAGSAGGRLHMLIQKALVELKNRYFDDSAATCDKIISEIGRLKHSFSAPKNASVLLINSKKIQAKALYFAGEQLRAAEIAKMFPDDAEMIDLINGRLQDTALKLQGDNEVSAFERMPEFVKAKLREISIDSMLQSHIVTDGGYRKGKRWEAEKEEYGTINGKMRDLPILEQAKWHFVAAKYIYNFLLWADSDEINESKILTDNQMKSMVCKGLELLLLDSLNSSKLDSARYFCTLLLEVGDIGVRMLTEDNETLRTYILSYFKNAINLRDNNDWTPEKLAAVSSYKLNVEFDRFFDGLLAVAELADKDVMRKILEYCWYNSEISDDLKRKLDCSDDVSADSEHVQREFSRLCSEHAERRKKETDEIAVDDLSDLLRQDVIVQKEQCLDNAVLYGQDDYYRGQLIKIFDGLKRPTNSFESSTDKFRTVKAGLDHLIRDIEKNPTAFSYSCLLPAAYRLSEFSDDEIAKRYKLLPEISVEYSDIAPQRSGCIVYLTIELRNVPNHQPARNPILCVESLTDGITPEESEIRIENSIPDGENSAPQECRLSFICSEGCDDDIIEVKISLSYSYYDSDDNSKTVSATPDPITLPTRSLRDADEFQAVGNPFKHYTNHNIVRNDDMFFGREHDISEIMSIISDDNGVLIPARSIALWGQKRSGKSSLWYHVKKRIEHDCGDNAIILDIESIGRFLLKPEDLTWQIMDLMLTELLFLHEDGKFDGKLADLCKKVSEVKEKIELEDNYHTIFNSFIESFIKTLAEMRPNCRLVVCCDEFTYLYSYIKRGLTDERFLVFWKAFSEKTGCVSIMIGQDSMPRLHAMPQCTNALAGTELYKVQHLSEEASRKFVLSPLKGEKCEIRTDAVKRLYELTAGSAYLLMILCSCLVDYINEHKMPVVNGRTIDSIADFAIDSNKITKKHFEPQFDDGGTEGDKIDSDKNHIERNLELLSTIAKYEPEASFTAIKSRMSGWTDEMLKEFLEALVDRSVLSMRDQKYSIIVGIFKYWLVHYYQR